MIPLKITLDPKSEARAEKLFGALADRAENLDGGLRNVGEALLQVTDARFASQTDPDGTAWSPLAKLTQEIRGNAGPILTVSGRLRKSISYAVSGGTLRLVPTKVGKAAHVMLPAATSGEMNLTSMNGERRMRLTERYMDPPGAAMPDCLIAARLANHMQRVLGEMGKADMAAKFSGFDWKTEEDAFMDGYHGHEKGGEFVTYERLRAMGANGLQEPATGVQDGKIVGTKRLFADGKFNKPDGKAVFAATQWRGLEAPGKQAEKDKFPFLINNGRANLVWQSAYLDVENESVMDRWPFPFIEMSPKEMTDLGVKDDDLVEDYNDNGSTQAMAYPTPTAKSKQAFMLFGYPTAVQGNVVSAGVNEFVIPNYKQTRGSIRKIADAPKSVQHLTFKSKEYPS